MLTAGDPFDEGDLMAVVRSMSGEKLAEVRAEYSGFLVSWSGGVAFQAGSSLGSCGLPDGLPMVVNCECRNALSPRCRLTQTVRCRQTMTLSAASCSGTQRSLLRISKAILLWIFIHTSCQSPVVPCASGARLDSRPLGGKGGPLARDDPHICRPPGPRRSSWLDGSGAGRVYGWVAPKLGG